MSGPGGECGWCGRTRAIVYTDVLDLDWCDECYRDTFLENFHPELRPEVGVWTREGGLRLRWLARLTKGRFGLGRWTRAEVERHHAYAEELHDLDDVAREFGVDLGDDA